MRHAILMAGISMLAISDSALAASPIPPNSADLAAPKVQLAQVQVPATQPSPSATIVTTPSSPPAWFTTIYGHDRTEYESSVDDRRHRADSAPAAASRKPAPGAWPQLCVVPRALVVGRYAIRMEARQLCRSADNGRALDAGILATGSDRLGLDRRQLELSRRGTGSDGRPRPDLLRHLAREELAVFEIAGKGAALDHGLAAQHDE
jgi:hypothetical protein